MTKRWKFLRENLISENGDLHWEKGVWKKQEGEMKLCENGFHCSKKVYQAFSYVQGEILAQVEVRGKKDVQDDKEAWSEMKIVRTWKWQKKDSVSLSIFAAELCLKNFEKVFPNDKRPREAIEAAKRWLESPTKENEAAAWSAESAVWSAELAARSAGLAGLAAGSELVSKIADWMDKRVKVLEELKKI